MIGSVKCRDNLSNSYKYGYKSEVLHLIVEQQLSFAEWQNYSQGQGRINTARRGHQGMASPNIKTFFLPRNRQKENTDPTAMKSERDLGRWGGIIMSKQGPIINFPACLLVLVSVLYIPLPVSGNEISHANFESLIHMYIYFEQEFIF